MVVYQRVYPFDERLELTNHIHVLSEMKIIEDWLI
jgi:hypothetical protein